MGFVLGIHVCTFKSEWFYVINCDLILLLTKNKNKNCCHNSELSVL